MAEPIEVELKLALDPGDHERVARAAILAAVSPVRDHLISTYFDTPDLLLRERGVTLRVRQTADGMIQTVKADSAKAAGLFARPEWERILAGDQPIIDAASGPLAALLGGEPVAPRFATDVTRTRWMIQSNGATIEVALDHGEVRAGEFGATLSELELELKEGSPDAIFACARALAAIAPLRLGVEAKSERGYALVEGRQQRAFKAERILLDLDDAAGVAFARIAQSCIRHFRLNETLLLQSGDVDALHHARVGLRRLRSAFSLFRHLFEGDPVAHRLARELRWLAGTLGDARNLDVLIGRSEGEIRHRLGEARAEALAAAKKALDSDRALAMMFDLAEWLAIGQWRVEPCDARRFAAPIEHVATTLLDEHRRRLKKRGHRLARLDDAHRHKVRIETKKLRYATEFFVGLWKGKKAIRRYREFQAALEELQDALGALNDLVTAPHIFAQLGLEPPEDTDKDRRDLLDRAETAHDALMDAKRFWK